MPDRESIDDVLQRTGLVALMYYPEIHVDDPDYTVDRDVDFCLEPLAGLTGEQRASLGNIIGLVITNPTAHRNELLHALLGLAPAES